LLHDPDHKEGARNRQYELWVWLGGKGGVQGFDNKFMVSQKGSSMDRNLQTKLWWGIFIAFLVLPALACDSPAWCYEGLAETDLSGRDFSYCALYDNDLSGKNLQDANFTGALLDNTDFSDSDLRGAKLELALLLDANFAGAKLDEKWARIIDILVTLDGAGQDYSGYDMSRAYLGGADFTDAVLLGTDFEDALLSQTNFTNANLSGANLRDADLYGTVFLNANLTDADLKNANLSGADLLGAIVSQSQLNHADLKCTRLPDGSIARESYCEKYSPMPWKQ
jgi:uncharacterized protein YjbI with pentapeptide repeats